MASPPPPLRAVVFSDDAGMRLAVGTILGRCGFEVAAEVETRRQALAAAEMVRPDAMVVDLALTGTRGLRLVGDLVASAPGCAVVLLSPYTGLRQAALEAGAVDLLGTSDFRALERVLHRVGTIPAGCDCWLNHEAGPGSGEVPVADPDSTRAPSVRHHHHHRHSHSPPPASRPADAERRPDPRR